MEIGVQGASIKAETAQQQPVVAADHSQSLPVEKIGVRSTVTLPHEEHDDIIITYRLQGDRSMYTPEALDRLQELSKHSTPSLLPDLF